MLASVDKQGSKKKKQVQTVRPRLRLSPNELDRLYKEEVDKRRKLRLIQVRQVAKENAREIREAVKATRKKELEKLALEVQVEWEKDRASKLEELEELYQKNLDSVGDAHQAAALHDDHEEEKLAQQEEDLRRADERHHAAMQKLIVDREREYEEANRAIIARHLALKVEQERAAKIASLPPPPPNPIIGIVAPKVKPIQFTDASAFSSTHYHVPDMCAVVKATEEEQVDAKAAAELEQYRYDETVKEVKRERHEQHEKARLRHNHALSKELLKQDYEQILHDLSDLQREAVHKRQQQVATIPKQIFAPPHRRLEERKDEQCMMERAFEDMYLKATDYVGNISLALDPHPPPETPAASECLDLSEVHPDVADTEPMKLPAEGVKPATSTSHRYQMAAPPPPPPLQDVTNVTKEMMNNKFNTRDAQLKKLLNRVKTHRDAWMNQSKEQQAPMPERPPREVARPSVAPSDGSGSETLTQYTLQSEEDMGHDGTSLEEGTITSSASSDTRLVQRAIANLKSQRERTEQSVPQTPADDGTLLHPMEQANRIRNKPEAEEANMAIFLGSDGQQKQYLEHKRENERRKIDNAQRNSDLRSQKEELKKQIAEIEKKRQMLLLQEQQQQSHLQHHQLIVNFQNNLSPPHKIPPSQQLNQDASGQAMDFNKQNVPFAPSSSQQSSSSFDPNTPFHHPNSANVSLDRVRAYQLHLLKRDREQPVEQSRTDLERRTQELLDSYESWKQGNSPHSPPSLLKQTNAASRYRGLSGLEPFEDVDIPSTYAGSKFSPTLSAHYEADRSHDVTLPSHPDSSVSQMNGDRSASQPRYLHQVIQHSSELSGSHVAVPIYDGYLQQRSSHGHSFQYSDSHDPNVQWASNISKMADDDQREFDHFNEQKKMEFEQRQSDLRQQLEEIRRQKQEIIERQQKHQQEMEGLKEKWSSELRSYRDNEEVSSRYIADPSSVDTTPWNTDDSPSMNRREEFLDELSSAEQYLSGLEQTSGDLVELEQLEAEWEARQALERDLQKQRAMFVPHELSTIQEIDTPASERVPSRPSTQRRQYSASPIQEEDAPADTSHSSRPGTGTARSLNFNLPPPDGTFPLTGNIDFVIHTEPQSPYRDQKYSAPKSSSDVLDAVLQKHKTEIDNMAKFKPAGSLCSDLTDDSFEPQSEGIVIGSGQSMQSYAMPHQTSLSDAHTHPHQTSINTSAANISTKPSWHEILAGFSSTSSEDSSMQSERRIASAIGRAAGHIGGGQLSFAAQNTSSPKKDGTLAWSDLTSGGILDLQFQSPIEAHGNATSYHRLSSTPCKPAISEVRGEPTLSSTSSPANRYLTPVNAAQHSVELSQHPLPSSGGSVDMIGTEHQRSVLSQYPLDSSQSSHSPNLPPPSHLIHPSKNPPAVVKEVLGDFPAGIGSMKSQPYLPTMKATSSVKDKEIDDLVARYMPLATGVQPSGHLSRYSEDTDSSWQASAANDSGNLPTDSMTSQPPPAQKYAHLISSLPSSMQTRISRARHLIDSDTTQSETDDPVRAHDAITRKVENAVAQYERLLAGNGSPEDLQLLGGGHTSSAGGGTEGASLDDSMTGLTASVNQLTLLVNDHTQRRQQEAAAKERARQVEEAQRAAQMSERDPVGVIDQQQEEFQQMLSHRRKLRGSPSPRKMHQHGGVSTPQMTPHRQLDRLAQEGVGISDEPDLTLVSLHSDFAETSMSKSPHEKGQSSLLSFEDHETTAAMDTSMTPKVRSPNSMLKNTSRYGGAAVERSKVTKGVTWKVDDDGNLMQRKGFDSSHDDPSGMLDSDAGAAYDRLDYSADLETSDDRARNYSTDDYGSAQDADDRESTMLSLAEAFKRRRADFISGTNKRHQDARGKVKKKLTGHGALSKTLASWKKSHTVKKAPTQASGSTVAGSIDRALSMKTTGAGEKKKFEVEMKQRTGRLYNLTEEAKMKKQEEARKKQYSDNREKAKLYQKKHQEQVKKRQEQQKKKP